MDHWGAMGNLRVAVVIEDDEDILHLLESVLVQAGFEVHTAVGGHEGVETVRMKRPAVVTVDVALPDIDGFEVLRQIREFSNTYVVMLTGRTEESDLVTAFDGGADDYILKPFRPWEVRFKIGAMMRRPRNPEEGPLPAPMQSTTPYPGLREVGVLQHNGLTLDLGNRTASANGSVLELTRSEFDVLHELLRGAGSVRTRSDLVRAITGKYSQDEDIPEADQHALEAHIGNLRRKLGETAHAPRLLQTVHGLGYRLAPDPRKPAANQTGGTRPWT